MLDASVASLHLARVMVVGHVIFAALAPVAAVGTERLPIAFAVGQIVVGITFAAVAARFSESVFPVLQVDVGGLGVVGGYS